MKKLIPLLCFAAVIALFVIGCAAMNRPLSQSSLPVVCGSATNGTPAAVGWLQYASAVNASSNPTPTEAPVGVALAALTTLVSAGLGWYARNHTASKETAATLTAAQAACAATVAASVKQQTPPAS